MRRRRFDHSLKARPRFLSEYESHIADYICHSLIYLVCLELVLKLALEYTIERGDGRSLPEKRVLVVLPELFTATIHIGDSVWGLHEVEETWSLILFCCRLLTHRVMHRQFGPMLSRKQSLCNFH